VLANLVSVVVVVDVFEWPVVSVFVSVFVLGLFDENLSWPGSWWLESPPPNEL
jgi:hypothetical protein